jgi:uncharacterized protein (TIGR00266 family)
MEFEYVHKPSFTILKVKLKPYEELTVESGSYMLHKGDIEIITSTGGIISGLKRAMLGGETFFLNTLKAKSDVEIWISPNLPGDIEAVELKKGDIFIEDSSYLAHYGDIKVDIGWRGLGGLIAEGELFWLKASGNGIVFINSYGGMDRLYLNPGEKITIDNMHFVALDGTIKWNIRKFGGWKSFLFGGEGFVIDAEGPGRVWIQSRNLPIFARIISKFIPIKNKSSSIHFRI